MTIALYLLGALTIASSLGVILSRKPLHSALWLIVTFFLLAGIYATLSADFLAVLQVLVYAGAIMVLVVFVLMLLGSVAEAEEAPFKFSSLFVLFVVCCFGYFIATSLFVVNLVMPLSFDEVPLVGSVKPFGHLLFTKYLYAFELIGVLILAATIGAVLLAKEARRKLPQGRGLKAKQEQLALESEEE